MDARGQLRSWHEARIARHDSMEERRRRWDEEHEKLRQLMLMYKQKAAYNAAWLPGTRRRKPD